MPTIQASVDDTVRAVGTTLAPRALPADNPMVTDEEQRGQAVEPRSANDWLARHGGVILVATGVALITLAAVYSTRVAVAPVFAFTGIASVILGVVLPRVEALELSQSRIKLVLSRVLEAVAARRTPEEIGVLYEHGFDQIAVAVSGREPSPALLPSAAPESALPPSAPAQDRPDGISPRERLSPLAAPTSASLQKAVMRWLERNGWDAKPQTGNSDPGWDVDAVRNNERIAVQVKAAHAISAADIAAVAVLRDHFQLDVAHAVLVVPDATLSEFALRQAQAAADVLTVYAADTMDGTFRLVSGHDVVPRGEEDR